MGPGVDSIFWRPAVTHRPSPGLPGVVLGDCCRIQGGLAFRVHQGMAPGVYVQEGRNVVPLVMDSPEFFHLRPFACGAHVGVFRGRTGQVPPTAEEVLILEGKKVVFQSAARLAHVSGNEEAMLLAHDSRLSVVDVGAWTTRTLSPMDGMVTRGQLDQGGAVAVVTLEGATGTSLQRVNLRSGKVETVLAALEAPARAVGTPTPSGKSVASLVARPGPDFRLELHHGQKTTLLWRSSSPQPLCPPVFADENHLVWARAEESQGAVLPPVKLAGADVRTGAVEDLTPPMAWNGSLRVWRRAVLMEGASAVVELPFGDADVVH